MNQVQSHSSFSVENFKRRLTEDDNILLTDNEIIEEVMEADNSEE